MTDTTRPDDDNIINIRDFREKRSRRPVAPGAPSYMHLPDPAFSTGFLESNIIARRFKEQYYGELLAQTEFIDRNPFYRRLRKSFPDDIAIFNVVRSKTIVSSFYRDFPDYSKQLPAELVGELASLLEKHKETENFDPSDIIDSIIPFYDALEKYIYDEKKFAAMTVAQKTLASRLFSNMSFAWWVIYRRADRTYHSLNVLAGLAGFIGIYILIFNSELPCLISPLEDRDKFICVSEDYLPIFEQLFTHDKLFAISGFRFITEVFADMHRQINFSDPRYNTTGTRYASYRTGLEETTRSIFKRFGDDSADSNPLEILAVAFLLSAILKLKKIDLTLPELMENYNSANYSWMDEEQNRNFLHTVDNLFP